MNYKPYFEKTVLDSNHKKILSLFDKALEEYSKAYFVLSKFTESTNSINNLESYNIRVDAGNHLLSQATHNLLQILKGENSYEISLELFVKVRLKLIGKDTVIEKNFPLISNYAGHNVRSLLIEMKNIIQELDEIDKEFAIIVRQSMNTQFIMTVGSYNKVVRDTWKSFIIKDPVDIIIPKNLLYI